MHKVNNSFGFSAPIVIAIIVVVAGITGSGYIVYKRSHSSIKTASTSSNSTSKSKSKTAQTTSNTKTAAPSSETTSPTASKIDTSNYSDGNFVALNPNGGLMTNVHSSTFKWTPHKLATTYEVQIRYIGQASYPAATPTDQIVTYTTTSGQPDNISITKDLPDGDYQWHVVAKGDVNGVLTVLQSTEDRYYQIRTY